MHPISNRWFVFFALLAVLFLGSWVLYRATPAADRNGEWGHCVLRNWQDFGFFNLKGKLVCNPGGENLPEHPFVYAGHRALGLYPAYFIDWASGGCEDGLAFHLVFSVIIGIATWLLLGRSLMGMVAAALVVFSAGYLRVVTHLDLFAIPVLFGVPFFFYARELLDREKLAPGAIALLVGAVAVYAPLNWTTIFSFAITVAYLAVALPKRLTRILLFTLLVGTVGAAVLGVSLASKAGGASSANPSALLARFWNQYLLGPLGYDGQGMSWRKAITRLTAVNTVVLLPLWLMAFWQVWRAGRREGGFSGNLLFSLLPLLTAILSIAGLRNYFAHHPWMAAPVLIYGIVFSLRLLRDRAGSREAPVDRLRTFAQAGALIGGGFLYGFVLLLCLNVNSAGENALLRLARQNTARHDVFFFSTGDEPWLAQNWSRLAFLMDRKLMPLPDSTEKPLALPSPSGSSFQLSSHVLPAPRNWLARTELEAVPGQTFVARILDWYRAHVSRRAQGDRIVVEELYLYRIQ